MPLPIAAVGLDAAMIAYTSWHLGRAGVPLRVRAVLAVAASGWLAVLGWLLPAWGPLPERVSGVVFYAAVLGFVAAVGAGLYPFRHALLALSDRDLLVPQGIRVFFGASFLAQAATGALPGRP